MGYSQTLTPATNKRMIVRTGCITCLAKGLRCNTKHSQCRQRQSTAWRSNRPQENSHPSPRGLTTQVDFTWNGTIRERASLHFFATVTAPNLGGLLDSSFWQRLVLQASRMDNAIKHIVAAIAAAHECCLREHMSRFNWETEGLRLFALRQCNKSIKYLLGGSTTGSLTNLLRTLTASVLFSCYESLAGNRSAALPHILYSRKLLEQYTDQTSEEKAHLTGESGFPVDSETIRPLVMHYECQVGDVSGESYLDDVLNALSSVRIESLADARTSLEANIAACGNVFLALATTGSSEEREVARERKSQYVQYFRHWGEAFSAYMAREGANMDATSLNGCKTLQLHHRAITICASVAEGGGKEALTSFIPDFATMIDTAEDVVNALPKNIAQTPIMQGPFLSHTMGLTEPLYLMATRCPDLSIATRAKDLIGRLPLSEGARSKWRVDFLEQVLTPGLGPRMHTFD